MTLISFLLQANLCLLVFYFFYRLFLHKETFFTWNRVYLLVAVCFSFVLPILRFEWLSKSSASKELQLKIGDILVEGTVVANTNFDWIQLLYIAYFSGLGIAVLFLFYKLWHLRSRIRNPQQGIAFSFFRFKRVDPNLADFETINRHEEIHVQQLHSLDILLMEIAGIIVWFNPVIYLYKLNIKTIHEYLADEAAARFAGSKKKYALLLLSRGMGVIPELSNSFIRHSEVKKRILMLQRERSAKQSLWKYLWIVPLLSTLLLCSSAIKGTKATRTFDAVFPGGLAKFVAYLKTATKYPAIDLKNRTEGKVMVTFIIDKDGNLIDAEVKKGVSPGLDQEAIRLISNSPKWIPGNENGIPVRIRYDIGVNFKLKK